MADPAYLTWMNDVLFAGLVLAAGLTLLVSYRVIRGPTVPDRVVALDTIGTNVVAIAALYAIWSNQGYFVGVSLVLAIIGFISTITVARYVTEGDIIE
ncbi:pH regulation protein F [Haloferax mediterranei ATCC 33500]|uniref:PH adaptation potassium efflux system protein F (Sodium-potassium/hydrogen antiporter subunit F) n=2 Tax=Halobacteriales TaxID=2235 RepID=I3R3H1_HALMT|nr:cation:proton antiporter [Haloferax mediterranei]AFK18781.1 pH adaptation potassium efflux system protein F (sodium-potassium/hydrogen antiporter subunit F) [Haloferax mediterranei ATCC 33500]AHZ21851.1 pH regulation protein F [Haloferax mediterranei ATCC 33500]EMA03360.1 pH adaptation potassium efflux system protein F (sodium-potassium/hydrogen antiporter subunit F) [Haloferax mediterranei ATCC 33500]MDX5988876.1 cation:proton antiporter [Haloferax mediterranei ATCC 33500]QCQ75274.1 pH reg